ncbi:MAG: 3-mercaptopyruvate sulfurtransferase [Neomegalonema sp.]|nr:3-mercaptopyruvate sulfurtransferase [Neomegalonema sp.]
MPPATSGAEYRADPQTIVSADWLKDHLAAPDVRVVDASWHLPTAERNPRAEYEASHIPGAVFFDIDEISDDRSALPHMLPPLEKFMSRIRRLGLGDGHRIVVYDSVGIFSAPRVWWMFRYFGHRDVAVLDGGLPAWIEAGGAVEDLEPTPRERHFTPSLRSMMLKDVTQVSGALKVGDSQIVDVRPADRFRGDAPEPRPGVRSGHMPGAINLPYKELLTENGRLKSAGALRVALADAGVDLKRPIVTSCGSGVSAAILNLALEVLGADDCALYDGSWAEWGASEMLPVEQG